MQPESEFPADEDLCAAVEAAVYEAREHVLTRLDADGYIPELHEFPSLSVFDSGWPNVHHKLSSGVPEYSGIFKIESGQFYVGWDQLPRLRELLTLAREHQGLRERLGPPAASLEEVELAKIFEIAVSWIPHRILDRLMHLHGREFEREDFLAVYAQVEPGILESRLPIEIWVPIALTRFDRDTEFEVGPNAHVRAIPDDLHLARVPKSIFTTVHHCVVSAATHALVLSGYDMDNANRWTTRLGELSIYPVEKIERFFHALRIAAGVETGFAQVFVRPVGWAHDYTAGLPPVEQGAFVRRYPSWFDDYGWLRSGGSVSYDELATAREVFSALPSAPETLKLAARRLSNGLLREDEEDAILDFCIALEASLGDKSPTEITHKLALRAAAVLAADDYVGRGPEEIFRSVKKVYGYRSAVVHGDNPDAKKLIRWPDGSESSAVELAQDYLRRVLLAQFRQPELRTAKGVDESVILASLSADRAGESA